MKEVCLVENGRAEGRCLGGIERLLVVLARLEVDRLPVRDPPVLANIEHLDRVLARDQGVRGSAWAGGRATGPRARTFHVCISISMTICSLATPSSAALASAGSDDMSSSMPVSSLISTAGGRVGEGTRPCVRQAD